MSKTHSRASARTNLKAALTFGVGLAAFASSMPATAQDTGDEQTRTLQTVTITATKARKKPDIAFGYRALTAKASAVNGPSPYEPVPRRTTGR